MRNSSYDDTDRTEMVLTFAGLEGSEQEHALSKPIEILAWSFGASYGVEGDKKTPSTYLQNLSMTQYVSEVSPTFLKCLASNRIFKTVILECTNKSQTIKLVLQDAFLTHTSTGGSGGESRLTENIGIGFKAMESFFEDRTKENGKMVSSGPLTNDDLFTAGRRS